MSHQSSHPTPHYLRFGPKIGVTVKMFARAAVTKRNAIERGLWRGQFEVYSSFGYPGACPGGVYGVPAELQMVPDGL